MRFTVAHITVDDARKALSLDANKTPEQIRDIVARRGMEAESIIDAAMTRAEFDDSVDASWHAQSLQHSPSIFDVVGLKYDGAILAGGFDWEVN